MADVLTTDTYPNAYEGVPEARPKRGGSRLQKMIQSENIAEDLGPEELARIGNEVVRGYEIDLSSRSDWETRCDEAMDLALQVTEEKQYPWPKAANIKYPLMTTAAIQFNARAYPAIVQGKNVVKGQVRGSDDGIPQMGPDGQQLVDEQAGPQWQVPPGAKRDKADRIARHMSYQLTEEMEEWEDETDRLLLVLPIIGCAFRKTWFDPSLSRNRSELVLPKNLVVNYKTKTLELARRITQDGIMLSEDQVTERIRMGLYLDIKMGIASDSDGDEDAPHEFLEQHRKLDLDEDGYAEPYVVTVHKETRQVVRIIARFDSESVYTNLKGEVAKILPDHYFTKYDFMPSPDGGFYGIGFGVLLQPLNEAVNTTLNQMIDAGHLQNTGGGFIGRGLRIKGGSTRFRPGEYKPVDVAGGTVRDNVVNHEFPGPSVVLFSLLGLLIDAAKDISSVKDILTGEQQKVEPATTTLARIEQGLKVFSAIYKRVFRSLKKELKLLFKLNQKFLDPQVYFTLLDVPEAIGQQDYDPTTMDVIPVADPAVVTDQQRLAIGEFLMQFLGDPYMNGREIRERILNAVRVEDIDKLLIEGDPPPPPDVMQAADEMDIEKRKLEQEGAVQQADIALKSAQVEETESKTVLNYAKAGAEQAKPDMAEMKESGAIIREKMKAEAAEKAAKEKPDGEG